MSGDSGCQRVKASLRVHLPTDYCDFLNTTGYLRLDHLGIEIYGDRPDFDVSKIPSVIAATLLYRQDGLLPTEIVIAHTGNEDVLVTLDTADGCVYEVGYPDHRVKVANSFRGWLADIVARNAAMGSGR